MKKIKAMWVWVALILGTLILNGAFYSSLPEQVGLQTNSGKLVNYVDKSLFLFLVPAIQLVIAIYLKWSKKSDLRIIILNAVFLAVDLVILYANL
ncbi:DUF1648 domain-containing protein [Gorillibacterium sp. sgz500922]|uniref:DUF1648 domain-containing protein n=1 Tax=Gorillibacterium sp. sgz500922 TaxID=3446694 RepID=UPI003F67B929